MQHPSSRARSRMLAGAVTLSVLLSACGGGATDGAPDAPPVVPPTVPDDARAVTVLHPYTGDDDVAGLDAIIADFIAQHPGITVRAVGSGDVESLVRARIDAGEPADIVLHPRLDLLAGLVDDGLVLPLDAAIDASTLEPQLVAGLVDLVTFDGRLTAVPLRLTVKSLVWYSPATFMARGERIPETWAEMTALSERMRADGLTPWCIGIESAGATGWVVTDWVEDILLRSIGVDAFDEWVAGELAFASDDVRGALETYLVPIWTDDDAVVGGRARIVTEAFGASAEGILGDEPTCGLHRQARFIEDFLVAAAPDASFAVDYDFFALPSITPGDRPVLGGGEFAALLSDDPSALLLMKFLATPGAGVAWAARGGYLSPFAPVLDASVYSDDSARRASAILARATAFRTDGSDRMPRAVGSSPVPGSFWTEMTAWVADEQTLDEALAAIDALYATLR
jgi:alpha-glucoside transport system substrate-binding protein